MLRIAVCDDNPSILKVIVKTIKDVYNKMNEEIQIDSYNEGLQLLRIHEKVPYEVVFLDISMPIISGFDIAEKLRAINTKPYIVFVSSKDELVYESFEYMPFYFIRKKSVSSLNKDIENVIIKLNRFLIQKSSFFIEDYDYGHIKVKYSDVIYIKSDNHYLNIVTSNLEKALRVRENIKTKEQELQDSDFIRIHKQYLINLHNASKIDFCQNEILMCNDEVLKISKNYREHFYDRYKLFLRDSI